MSLSSVPLFPINHYNNQTMKRFKVVFIRDAKVIGGNNQPVILQEQFFLCPDTGAVNIQCPAGFRIHTITEYLPEMILKPEKDEKLSKN